MRIPIPLRERRADVVLAAVCVVFAFTTFVPDVTAILGIDLLDFEATRADPPLWPPLFVLEGLVDYGRACDLLFLHNPPWFQAVMWGDVLVLGPYYVAATYALWRGRDWIRIPTFVYAAHTLTVAPLLVFEHLWGPHASPDPAMLFAFYAPYWILPVVMMLRMRRPHPMTREAAA